MPDDKKDPPSLKHDRRSIGYKYPEADPGTGTGPDNPKTFYYRQYYDIKAARDKKSRKSSSK